jgi:hypothetical protein
LSNSSRRSDRASFSNDNNAAARIANQKTTRLVRAAKRENDATHGTADVPARGASRLPLGLERDLGYHTLLATGVTAYLKNGRKLEAAADGRA